MSIFDSSTTTLVVPDELAELFQLAALSELDDNVSWLRDQADQAAGEGASRPSLTTDRGPGSYSYIAALVALLGELFAGSRVITSQTTLLAYVADTMARSVGNSIAESSGDPGHSRRVAGLTKAHAWATAVTARLEADFRGALGNDGSQPRSERRQKLQADPPVQPEVADENAYVRPEAVDDARFRFGLSQAEAMDLLHRLMKEPGPRRPESQPGA